MSDKKTKTTMSREERLAEQLRANLRRRKMAAKKSTASNASETQESAKKDTSRS